MKLFLVIPALLATLTIYAYANPKSLRTYKSSKICLLRPIKIGVVDTGFGFEGKGRGAPLCQYGHKDFSVDQKYSLAYNTKTPVPVDLDGHGTNIAGLIANYADEGKTKYCLVIIKYFSHKQSGYENSRSSAQAFRYANNLKLEVVNYSGGGPSIDFDERDSVEAYLDRGGKLIAAAGNESIYLDGLDNGFYPAMYDSRITIVGNKDIYGAKAPSSNYGPYVTTWENGNKRTAYGITMTGTSQATAVTTGKYVASLNSCDR